MNASAQGAAPRRQKSRGAASLGSASPPLFVAEPWRGPSGSVSMRGGGSRRARPDEPERRRDDDDR
jgi:hypothetical protein